MFLRRDRNNPKLCRHLLMSDIEKIKSSILLNEVNVRTEQFIDKKSTTGLVLYVANGKFRKNHYPLLLLFEDNEEKFL